MPKAVPMLHVSDVDATADWYQSIGFTIENKGSDGQDIIFALLSFGESEVMLSAGGSVSQAPRRDADLYLYVDDVGTIFPHVSRQAELVEGLHDTFYGMREFIVRDINGFWLTFGQRLPKRAN
ncbi:hypothetical protein SAMN04488498_108183 [Mesorhizobium albiziae]|uniref:VOC domain-containing protein n=1 Tax=Neomesorhizobium albiziae TaxID=335020 RepID=A0A1I4ANG0_9HYPH|nr:VOC family protein [Mesorhizobium albiziae]GLS32978.1 bleomycin resistance family protein [Mesorhizobium albiziae]SFK57914.1 hypothetical protein SAMN04488498_108183 [Mesorhizobium albiziae]